MLTWSKIVYWDKFLVAFSTYRKKKHWRVSFSMKLLASKDTTTQVFSANFAKSLRKLFLQNTSSRVLFQRKLTPCSSQFAKVSDCINYCGFLMFYFIKNGFLMFYFIKNLQPLKRLCISNIKQPYVRSLRLIRLFFLSTNPISLYFIQLLKNLFKFRLKIKKCWYHLFYTDAISFLAAKKCQKLRKIDEKTSNPQPLSRCELWVVGSSPVAVT